MQSVEEFVVSDGMYGLYGKCYRICFSNLPGCMSVAFYRLGGVTRYLFDACTVSLNVHYLLFHSGSCIRIGKSNFGRFFHVSAN
jgi:hypothetical protein